MVAIDLSSESLAYAIRKTDELNIRNIDYYQCDILNVSELNQDSHIIESSSVLHHMSDPKAGLLELLNCLKPGGLLRLGLYSQSARRHISEIREEIHRENVQPTIDEIRKYRNSLIHSGRDMSRKLFQSPDFYSLSNFRDLVFHVQEHQFTIMQIKELITDFELHFMGFEGSELNRRFNSTFPGKASKLNLYHWAMYEEQNPTVFSGMYQFWCQKPS